MNSIIPGIFRINQQFSGLLNHLQPVLLLLARIYVAWVFFASGLTKIQDWETTLFLFEYEYAVPILSPALAAWLGTIGELVLPVLLAFGLFGRLGAVGLGIVNIIAVISLADIGQAALNQHYIWGVLLAGIAVFGAGKLSVDSFTGAEK